MASKPDKPFYYIAGSTFFTDDKIKSILSEIDDCETETFNPEDLINSDFFGFINTAPLFSENKAAVVRSFDSVSDKVKIITECAACRESTIIFVAEETKIDKKSSDAMDKAGFTILIEAKARKYDLTGQIIRMFSEAGFTIDTSAAGEISELFSGDMNRVKSETDKLTAYFAYKKPKSQNDILNAITAKKHDNVFTFIDAFSTRKKQQCMILMNSFINSDENLPVLIYTLFKRMREIYLFQTARELIKENRPFMLDKIKAGAQAWKKNDLVKLIGLFAELDYMFKTGQTNDRSYLIRLISEI